MTIDYQYFGTICADSTTYTSLSDIFVLHNQIKDIENLYAQGETKIGYLRKNPNKHIKIKRFSSNDETIFCAKCDRLEVWESTTQDVQSEAWAYIDALAKLANNIRNRQKTLNL